MRLLDYVNKFAPVFDRKNLLNTLADLETQYTTTVASIIDDIEPILLSKASKSNILRRYRGDIMRRVNFNGDPLSLVFTSLRNMPSNFGVVQTEVKRMFSFQFTNVGLTVSRANVLKYIDAMSFYINYARRLLLVGLTEEIQALGKATPTSWSPADVEFVDNNMGQFCDLYISMSLPAQMLKQRLNAAADVEISEATFDLATRTLGDAKMDPLQMNGFSPQQNPLLLLGKYLAEGRVAKYDAAEDECRAIRHRLLEMQGLLAGDPTSPTLQRQIKQYEERVTEYEYKLELIMKKAGLET